MKIIRINRENAEENASLAQTEPSRIGLCPSFPPAQHSPPGLLPEATGMDPRRDRKGMLRARNPWETIPWGAGSVQPSTPAVYFN